LYDTTVGKLGRPVLRTVSATSDTLDAFREIFGTSTHCYRSLGLSAVVTYPNFQRWWSGRTVAALTHEAIEQAFDEWKGRMLEYLGHPQAA
jgi:hypothetical protein